MTVLSALLLIAIASGSEAAVATPCDTAAPESLWGSALVYDPARDNVLLFGGARSRREYVGTSWTWSDSGWTCHEGVGPAPRGFAAGAFDPEMGSIVIHGGRGAENRTLTDTWAWDGSGWRLLATEGPALDHHRMAWSPIDSTLFVFGGWDGERVRGDSWRWAAGGWRQLPVDGPPPRSAFAMAFDESRGRLVVHGGLWIEGQYADAWEWDGRRWTALWPPHANSSMDHHSMVFDRGNERLVVFGGKNYRYRPLGRTLALGEQSFVRLADDGPSPRHSFGFAYDPKRGRAILYGGKIYQGEEQVALDDLWLLEGTSWRPWRSSEEVAPEVDSSPTEGSGDGSARLEFRPSIP